MKKKLSLLMVAFMAVAAFAVQNSWRADGDEWTIAGSEAILGSSWDTNDTNNNMTSEDGITYTLVKENCTLEAGTTYIYKVVKNHDWANENYGANGELGGKNVELTVDATGIYTVTFTFVNDDSHALSAVAVKTGDAGPVTHTYGIVGDLTGGWENDAQMTQSADDANVYTLTIEGFEAEAKTYSYKLRADGKWGGYELPASGNNSYKFDVAGIYTLVFAANISEHTLTLEATKTGDVEEPTYIYAVVGGKKVADGEEADAAIFSGNWDAAGTTDFMTLDEESGKYVWTKEAAKLDPQTIALKVIKKVEGAEDAAAWYPTDDVEIVIDEAGLYNVTVTFDPKAEDLWAQSTVVATAEPVVEPVVINSLAIVGDFLGLEATDEDATPNWNPANGWTMKQDAENPAIWTLTKRFVAEAKNYEYKATANGNWTDYVLPEGDNANYNFDTADLGAGKYILTFTANTEEHTITLAAEKVVPVVFPENAVVFDFEAAAAAGENPANKNGSAANGQAFYAWEKADKTDSKRQDYKGYEWAEGSVLPEVCQVWRRSDRINGNVKDEGLYCPNDREFAVDGLTAGSKVIVVYDAVDATNKELLWAIGDGSGDETPEGPRATATINGVEAVTGETTIASGAEIAVNSVTPAENGTGYIVFQVKKGMYIKQIAVVPAEEKLEINSLAIVGDLTGGWPVKNEETSEWDWSMALQLTQDAENTNIWSATVENVEIEAKKYEYKAAANNSWDGYQLPADGNYDFVFGTDEYPAGHYNLTFTVDTEKNELTFVPEKLADFVEVATIPGNEALVTGKLLVIEAADEANANVIVKAGETEIRDIMADGLVFFELTDDAFTTGDIVILADKQISVTKAYVAEDFEGAWTQIYPAPVVINSLAIVGDFLGLEATDEDATPNWNPANGWTMKQDAENPAIWTLTKRFVAEAKNYEYKATANGNWTDYVLPEGDNANYNFDTADLGAGKYILTFTANTEEHTITLAAEKVVPVVFPENAVVFDFEAAAAAGENPANKNGSAANGQAFYAWEKADKTDSKRQDYKGYEWAEGSVLPEVCQVWRRSDRINGNVKDEGLYCPNDREFAVDGLTAGSKVIVVYDAVDATNKELLWAIGDGSGDETPEGPRATATINGVEAVTGETTIASGAEIAVNSVTPAENGTGYIVFQVKKGMYIKQIAVVPAEEKPAVDYYLVGDFNEWAINDDYKLTLNTEAVGVEEYMITDVELAEGAEFKVKSSTDAWYPEGLGNNYVVGEAGKYTIYFRPNADGGEGWHYNVIYAENLTVGINLVKADDLKNAEIFNLNGQRVQNAQKGLYIVNGRKVVIK